MKAKDHGDVDYIFCRSVTVCVLRLLFRSSAFKKIKGYLWPYFCEAQDGTMGCFTELFEF